LCRCIGFAELCAIVVATHSAATEKRNSVRHPECAEATSAEPNGEGDQ
jgi:hypothetical protein